MRYSHMTKNSVANRNLTHATNNGNKMFMY